MRNELKDLHKKSKLSLNKFADLLGVNRGLLCRYMSGKQKIGYLAELSLKDKISKLQTIDINK